MDFMSLIDLPNCILFTIFDDVSDSDLCNLMFVNKSFYQKIKLYLRYNNKRYKIIKLLRDPNYHNKKENCIICNRYVKKGSNTNSPYKRIVLNCCGKWYLVLHYKCYNTLSMTLKCTECNHVFTPKSYYTINNLQKCVDYQFNIDILTFKEIFKCVNYACFL